MSSFVIGIGSQRAGSTLLHRVLDECTSIFMHPVKELHYFDTLYGQRAERALKVFSKLQIDRELARIIAAQDFGFIDNHYRCYLRANQILWNTDIGDVDYVDLYHPCLSQHEIVGEITPEYMLIPPQAIQQMRQELGDDTKIILLARHPVQRFLSAFKLLKRYGGGELDIERFADELDDVVNTMPTWMEHQDRLNDYRSALRRFRAEFSQVLFLNYDQLIGDPIATYNQLTDFLEMDIDKERFDRVINKRVNSLGETGAPNAATINQLHKRFRKSIKFLEKSFGSGACVL